MKYALVYLKGTLEKTVNCVNNFEDNKMRVQREIYLQALIDRMLDIWEE